MGDWLDEDWEFNGVRDENEQDAWWRDDQNRDWDREAFDRYGRDDSLRAILSRLYLGGTTTTEADYSGFVSTGLAALVQDAAAVIAIDTQVVYSELAAVAVWSTSASTAASARWRFGRGLSSSTPTSRPSPAPWSMSTSS